MLIMILLLSFGNGYVMAIATTSTTMKTVEFNHRNYFFVPRSFCQLFESQMGIRDYIIEVNL